LRPSAGESGDARRSVEDQWKDLARESFDFLAVGVADTDAVLHFGSVPARLRSGEGSVRGVGSDEFREDVLEIQSEPVEALAQHTIGELRLLQRVGPRVHERTDGLVARTVRDGHLELVGRRLSLDAEDAYAIGSVTLEMNRREVGDHVGRDV